MYAKTALKLSVAMSNSRLPTNFQLNIFIIKVMRQISKLFFEEICQNSKVIGRYVQQKATYEFSAQNICFWSQGKPSNFTSVIEAKCKQVGSVKEYLKLAFLYR